MNKLTRGKLLSAVIGALCSALWAGAPAAAAPFIATQAPCKTAGSYCLSFTGASAIPDIRSFTFTAATAGKAYVSFHGSVYCGNGGTIADKVVDIATQIVGAGPAVPNPSGPGGLRLAMVLKDTTNNTQNTSDTFNLASTRVIPVRAGAHTVVFRIAALKIDTGVTCYVYNAAFSVIFMP